MKAIEFLGRIKENYILIPENCKGEIERVKDKTVRVIMLIDEFGDQEEKSRRAMVREQFLKGYAESDEIYDHE